MTRTSSAKHQYSPRRAVMFQYCLPKSTWDPLGPRSWAFEARSFSFPNFSPFCSVPPGEGMHLDGSFSCCKPLALIPAPGEARMGWKRHPGCWVSQLLPRGWWLMESRKQIALLEQVKIFRSRWHNQSSHYFYCLQNGRKVSASGAGAIAG